MTDKYIVVGMFNDADPGTLALPYKAQTAGDFDFIMRRLADPPNLDQVHIHIGPGTFYTRGQRHNPGVGLNSAGSAGWDVRSNWTISGAGEAATIIVLEQWPNIPITTDPTVGNFRRFAVMGCHNASDYFLVSGVTIENLTVDGRWDTLANKPATTFVAFLPRAQAALGDALFPKVCFAGRPQVGAPPRGHLRGAKRSFVDLAFPSAAGERGKPARRINRHDPPSHLHRTQPMGRPSPHRDLARHLAPALPSPSFSSQN